MTWPQVYDGKFWKAAIADSYAINSIPAAFLVDGDTGEILATGGSLRGNDARENARRCPGEEGEAVRHTLAPCNPARGSA